VNRPSAILLAWSRARSATFDDGLLLTFPHKSTREEMQLVLVGRARPVDDWTIRLVP
jgi:hypothetical protein